MRELTECTAEVFRRSERRISQRRKRRKYAIALCVPLCLFVAVLSTIYLPDMLPPQRNNAAGTVNQDRVDVLTSPSANDISTDGDNKAMCTGDTSGASALSGVDSFQFSLTWGCYGISSYDSTTGKLVKTTDATHPEDYITTYQLTAQQKQQIYELIQDLGVTGYPDNYDPHNGELSSSPSITLILSVQTDTLQKTITAKDIALTYEASNRHGQTFLSVCETISNILMETEEWKALPEYENFYD